MRADLFLLQRVGLRSMREHPGRTALTLAGIALGVSVFLAIRLANQGTLAGFRKSLDAIAGRAALEVTAQGEPFDERVFTRVRNTPGVRAATPLLQTLAAALPPPSTSSTRQVNGR
ncbi:MAG: ABC transporter permease, partial [Nitrospinota bacterium]